MPLLFSQVTDPACLEYILKNNNDTFVKGKMWVKNFGCLLGHGIFTSDGEQWLWQRKLATNIFSVKSFKRYMDEVFAAKLGLLINRLATSASTGAPVDLHELMYCFTLDSFAQIGFGVDPGCLTSQDKVPFAAAFDRAQVVSDLAAQGLMTAERPYLLRRMLVLMLALKVSTQYSVCSTLQRCYLVCCKCQRHSHTVFKRNLALYTLPERPAAASIPGVLQTQ
eukprot:GHUV01018271.1.p1 GENE.GHUV01018271.1~~GHUV01018271.1.p1  ORF type:complete len:223 (+),score=37.08 GHUV01018271.1:947-1615(+)